MYFERSQVNGKQTSPSPRRIAAAKRAIQKDKDSVPLFPEMLKYKTPEERILDQDAEFAKWLSGFRLFQADVWRKSRAALRSHPKKHLILAHWNKRIYPGDACYLANLIQGFNTGRVDIEKHNLEIERCRKLGEETRRQQTLKEVYDILAA